MTKSEKPAPKAEKPQAGPAKISADEFGIRQSVNDRRVEMLGAFVNQEKRAGRGSDFESAYRERLDKFAKKPA